jgi:diguanylate cyclase (GGDEF)-like protein
MGPLLPSTGPATGQVKHAPLPGISDLVAFRCSHKLRRALQGSIVGCCLALSLAAHADDDQDSLQHSFQDDVTQAQALARQAPTEALTILDRLIDSGDGTPIQRTQLYSLRAELRRDQGRLDEALVDAERARALAAELDDPELQADCLRVLGTIRAESGDMARALEHFHEAWSMLEGQAPSRTQLRIGISLGVGHQMNEDHARSEGYFEGALELARALGERHQEATILGNMAIARGQLVDPAAAIELHEEALAIFRELGNASGEAYQLANLCDRAVELGRLSEAERLCPKAEEKLEAIGHIRLLAGVRAILGEMHAQQGDLDAALTSYTQALELAEGQIPTVERDALDKLARLHLVRGEPDQAIAAYERYMDAREALWEQRNQETLAELEVQYDVAERERELRLATAESALQAAELEQRNQLLIAISIAAVVLLGLIVIILRNNQERGRLQRDLADRNAELEQALEQIGQLANRDPLTQLRNRRSFLDIAGQEIARARRKSLPMSVLVIDIDHFKQLNDDHGHAVGDEVLVQVAAELRKTLREQDVICRWGGEEFVAMITEADGAQAELIAERARTAIEATRFAHEGTELPLSITIGVAQLAESLDIEEAIDAADQAMYQGKRTGRNRVEVAAR